MCNLKTSVSNFYEDCIRHVEKVCFKKIKIVGGISGGIEILIS